MKLSVGDIRFSEYGYASATAEVETGTFPFLLFSICKMDVSVPLMEGKALEQYKDELLAKARERITEIYKEIVCGGETGEASGLLDCLGTKTEPSEFSCKVKLAINDGATNKDLEERVALLEKRLSEQSSPDMLKMIHDVSKKSSAGILMPGRTKKKIDHDVNGESFTFYGPDGTVHLQIGRSDEYSVGFPFRITDKCGQLFVHDDEGVRSPTHRHRDAIIDKVIRDLKRGNGNMLKRLGRCMGLLQVAAEIEAVSQMCESECERCRESILSNFDNPPFKNVPIGWISPGVKYLKRRI